MDRGIRRVRFFAYLLPGALLNVVLPAASRYISSSWFAATSTIELAASYSSYLHYVPNAELDLHVDTLRTCISICSSSLSVLQLTSLPTSSYVCLIATLCREAQPSRHVSPPPAKTGVNPRRLT
ncbi:hypothetical protein B0T10DRAFT_58596 [Thelonectria olida]|uniref:Uncharacterized protein n=1 Tax=Thelonectria olida TaxID=1576542 RepID=A0A9P8W3S7_9HYPO|nr:hypothetical protein B0T10DRAFT_58596 [Thelonectria olida]